jgi:23S rRNA (uracil1939-C5)-methyltransferase
VFIHALCTRESEAFLPSAFGQPEPHANNDRIDAAGGPRYFNIMSLAAPLDPGVEVVIEKLIPDGVALGRLEDGRVVMLNGAAPGDRVLLEEFSEKKGLIRAQRWALVLASSERVQPRCPVASECGGCDWMMLSENEQRRSKLSLLQQALRRTAKIADYTYAPLWAGERRYGYRSRVRLQVARGKIGFRRRSSHDIVEPAQCAVSEPVLNHALARLRELAARHPGSLDGFAEVELAADSQGGVAFHFESEEHASSPSSATSALLAELATGSSVSVGEVQSGEPPWQRFELIDGVYLLAPVGTFTQVNWEVNRVMIRELIDGAERRGIKSFLDLYAGAGNFSLPLLAKGLKGVSVEAVRASAHAAREAARRQSLLGGRFWGRDARRAADALEREQRRFDLVIIDPPRAGVKHGLSKMAALSQGWVVLCSCNPVTFARDLRALLDEGYELESMQPYDMFPQTHHLETLAWLRAPATRRSLDPS